MIPNKRGLQSTTGPGVKANKGSKKHMKLQDDQENLYNVQVGVASLNWPQVIQ